MAELTRERLGALRVQAKELLAADRREVLVCAGTGCIAGGSLKIYDYLKSECEKRGLKTRVALRHEGGDDAIHFKKSGCHGFCEMGPLLQIEPEGFLYTHVRLEDCDEIIERTILGGEAVERLLYELNGVRYAKHNEIPFYAKQQRVVLENCGTTDAEDIDEYLAHDGYAAFEKALLRCPTRTSAVRSSIPVCAAAAAQAFPRAESGTASAASPRARSMWSATATRATPARLWTAPSWRAIPIRSLRA
jgi:NADH-quinone oxidoreductase subunit F